MTQQAPTFVRDHDDLIAALRARKDALQVTDAEFEAKVGLTPGHLAKIIGDAPAKNMGPRTFERLLAGLGVALQVVDDPEPVLMDFERRERPPQAGKRVSRAALERAKPVLAPEIIREVAARASAIRTAMLSPEHRQRIAKKAAKSRWKQHKVPRWKRRILERKAARARERRAQRQQPSAGQVPEQST